MLKNNVLTLSIGISLGIIGSSIINMTQEVNYNSQVPEISKPFMVDLNANEKNSVSKQSVDKLYQTNNKVKNLLSKKIISIENVTKIFEDLSNRLHSEHLLILKKVNSNRTNTVNILNKKLTIEQSYILQQAESYLGVALDRGTWDAADVKSFNQLISKLSFNEGVIMQQQLLDAINEGEIGTELNPMQLFE